MPQPKNLSYVPITKRLVDRLLEVSPGGTISKKDLSEAIGMDIDEVYYCLNKARAVCRDQYHCVFKSIWRVGYRRVESEDIPSIGRASRQRIRKVARNGLKSMEASMGGFNNIEPDVQRMILREQSALGLIEHFSKDQQLPKLGKIESVALTPAQAARQFVDAVNRRSKDDQDC